MKKIRHSTRLRNLCVPIPLGAQVNAGGVLFSIFSRHATRVWLMLFKSPQDQEPFREYELRAETNRVGDIWFAQISEARAGMLYAYRMDGKTPEGIENLFNPRNWLVDPYAMAVTGHGGWSNTQGLPAGTHPVHGRHAMKGIVVDHQFNWGSDRPPAIPLQDTIYYETHVRGYTVHPSAKTSQTPGSYLALTEKIPYLKSLGIRSIELLPIHEFNEMEYFVANDTRAKLRNFWGYSSLCFFAPNSGYASMPPLGQQVTEFKQMVKAFHRAGIEVILDVVYNHTGEGGRGGPIYSMKGIDQPTYYMLEEDGKTHRNYTGCGNTVNCNHTVMQQLILHSLRYWKHYMHVDGFRFDLASIFTRGLKGEVREAYTIVDQIAEDPILRDVKLIAEAWDAAGLYQVGSFPHARWSEWNGRFRDDMRRFWKGDQGMLYAFTERFMASPDLYASRGWTPLKSVNLITCHDGFTLRDMVSYERKHNEANQEDNRDGENHNHSLNFGIEGPTDDPVIEAARIQQQKNLIATTLLAHGTPLLLAGDEFSRTQQGSNNAYCQDNEISWVDWSLLDKKQNKDLYTFTQKSIKLRRAQPSLRPIRFFHRGHGVGNETGIWWFNLHHAEPNWVHDHAIGCWINGSRRHNGHEDGDDLFIIFNNWLEPLEFTFPKTRGTPWKLALSTQVKPPARLLGKNQIRVEGRTVHVWTSTPSR